MQHRTITAATIIPALGAAVALAVLATAAPGPAPAATAVSAESSVTYLYRVEGDWVRVHIRPSLASPTRQPATTGFTLITDKNNGATGWILSHYLEELDCIAGDCE